MPGAQGEEICVISDELLKKLIAEQAPKAVKEYANAQPVQESGARDEDVTELRIDFESTCGAAACGC